MKVALQHALGRHGCINIYIHTVPRAVSSPNKASRHERSKSVSSLPVSSPKQQSQSTLIDPSPVTSAKKQKQKQAGAPQINK
jgi:hypothetical protein